MKPGILVVLAVSVVGLIALALALFSRQSGSEGPTAQFAVVKRGDLPIQILLTGRIEPRQKMVVKARVPGRIAQLYVEEGDTVRAGQPLARIESSELERQAGQLQAALGAMRAQVSELPGPIATRSRVAESLELAESELRIADRSLQQLSQTPAPLVLGGPGEGPASLSENHSSGSADTVSSGSLDRLERALGRARTELSGARAALAQQEAQLQTVLQMRGRVMQLMERAAAARALVQYLNVTAPMSGTVIKRNVLPGDLVAPVGGPLGGSQEIAVIGETSHMIVRAVIPEIDVARIRQGQAATVRLDALRDKVFAAKIRRLAPAAREQRSPLSLMTASEPVWFEVEVEINGTDRRLRTGMTANVDVTAEKIQDTLYLPHEALYEERGRWYAWRVTDRKLAGRVRKRVKSDRAIREQDVSVERALVHVGLFNDLHSQVRSGLQENDVVLIKPPTRGRRTFEIK